MALVSSGNQILLKGTSDTNPTGQSFYLDTTITSGSTSCDVIAFTRVQEGSDVFYGLETTLDGTVYGFKTAQTSAASGISRLARGFDDTNPRLSGSGIHGSGFFDNIDWFGSTPETFTGETWWTTRGVVGITLGVDSGSLGSIGTQSYTGGGSVGTLEVHHFGWFDNNSSNYPNGTSASTVGSQVLDTTEEGNWIMLTLKNTTASPPDSNDSFYSVIINGQEFLRSDAATVSQSSQAAYDSNVSSGTHYYRTWRWDAADVTNSDLSAIGTTGSKSFKLSQGASSTLNTGISEEMSAGTDTDPINFSDYYKDGTFHATSGIPTSGEIKFSDFYGKTRTPLVTNLAEGSFTSTYTVGQYVTTSGWGFNSAISPSSSTLDDGFSSALRGAGTGDVALNGIYNLNGGTIYVYFKRTNNSTGTFTDTGWSNLRIYLNQTNNSGTPDLTLTRTGATGFSAGSSSGNSAYYYYTATRSMSTYFGTNSNETHYVELD